MNFFNVKKHLYESTKKMQKITLLALLLSISLILNVITSQIKWPFASFLNIDISLMPVIICMFVFSFKEAFLLLTIRWVFITIMHVNEPVIWFGPLVQYIFALFYLVVVLLFLKITKNYIKNDGLRILIALFTSIIITSIFATFNNWLWVTAFYWRLYGQDVPINPNEFNRFLLENQWARIYFGNIPNWNSGVWMVFMPFNIFKFGMISLQALPLISIASIYFSREKLKFNLKKQ